MNAINKYVHVWEEFRWFLERGKHSQGNPYKVGNMHRVKWNLENLSFSAKGKLSIAMSEKCREEKEIL